MYAVLVSLATAVLAAAAPDTPFVQETHQAYPLASAEANDVRAVAVLANAQVYAGSEDNVYALDTASGVWSPLFAADDAGPVFALAANKNDLWIGMWNGLWQWDGGKAEHFWGGGPIAAIATNDGVVYALSGQTLVTISRGRVSEEALPVARDPRAVLMADGGAAYVATGMGLYRVRGNDATLLESKDGLVSENTVDVLRDADGKLWVATLGGCAVFDGDLLKAQYTPKEGLPTAEVTCAALAPDGVVWVGTTRGLARKTDDGFSVRWTRRWLLDDEVRDIAFDRDGTAWIATARGVSAIRKQEMTLAEKAAFFKQELLARHVREPWFVEKNRMPTPGDRSVFEPEDDDNDGEYTAEYTVMESMHFAVTGNPEAREHARRGMQALIRLQTITGTEGFIARTYIPADWTRMHDANRTYSERERAEEFVNDPRYKPVEERWRPTPDGKYLWKGDTSSDEITGHFYAFGFYYDLAANEEEKAELRDHVARVMDWLIDGGYNLRDTDGKHTRWGVWAPEMLNHDPNWQAERGINSAELCSYLLTAHHITGDAKYRQEYERLLFEEGYLENIRLAKNYKPAQQTHIDDCLLVKVWPALLRYETDPRLRAVYRASMDRWYAGLANEQNPFWNYTYGLLTGEEPQRQDSLFFLRDTPLDRINWTFDQRLREDIQIVRAPILEQPSTNRLLPPSERATVRWDKNPWMHLTGDGGQTEWAPTFWLLGYWMGRYGGFIAAP